MAPGPPAPPYRVFLTPSLHRRFAHASFRTFCACYAVAIWMGDWDHLFWSWFPLSSVGLRAGLLCIPALLIYVLRIAQWHVGERNTASPIEYLERYVFSRSSLTTVVVYAASAFLYGEVYIWSRAGKAQLGMTVEGLYHERIRLNERPLFLRSLFVSQGVIQAVIHVARNKDCVPIPVAQSTRRKRTHLQRKLVGIVAEGGMLAILTLLLGSLAYFLGLRQFVWSWWYSVAQNVYSLAKTSKPSGLVPFMPLLVRFLIQSTILSCIWQFSNQTFDSFMAQAPLKNGKPITTDSKDPNGSLLNGLRMKKEEAKNIAFWELAVITERFEDRRKTIYGELERNKGPTYKQVTDVCLAEIRDLVHRINRAGDPYYNSEDADKKQMPPAKAQLVGQIAQPLKKDPIAAPYQHADTRLGQIEDATSRIARTHSSPNNPQYAWAGEALKMSQATANQAAREAETYLTSNKAKLARSPLGWPFRISLARTAKIVINGAPTSRYYLILNAIATLTNLTVLSLKEDAYGQFQKEVPDIIRAFTAAIGKVEAYVAGLKPHWTDVDMLSRPEAEWRKIVEVEEVQARLREGLERMLRAFGEYLVSLDMSKVEIAEAKRCVARGSEVAEVR